MQHKLWNHRWKGHLKVIQFSNKQKHLKLDQVAQSPEHSNPALNVSRDRTSTTSLGNVSQGFTILTVKNSFPISHLNKAVTN